MKNERYNVKGFFVTGTDTGVGKTIIAGALIAALRMLGYRTCGMKPVETGCKKSKVKSQRSKISSLDGGAYWGATGRGY